MAVVEEIDDGIFGTKCILHSNGKRYEMNTDGSTGKELC